MIQSAFVSDSYLPQVNDAVGDFVSEIIWGEPDQFSEFCSMAVTDGERIIAGVVYHNWNPRSGTIEISCAALSPRWMTREIIHNAISMPFNALGVQAVVARHAEGAGSVRHIWNALGADEHVIPHLRGPNEAEVVAVLTAEQWGESRFNNKVLNSG